MMSIKFICFLIFFLHLSNMPFGNHCVSAHHQEAYHHQVAAIASNKGIERMEGEESRSLRALGSRPPNCEHKCRDCKPCYASQTPSTIDLVGLDQYTNYKPEGWKCKCGVSFFDP